MDKRRPAERALATVVLGCMLISLCLGLCSCERTPSDKIKIVCTVFPQYDWLRNIIGESERIELSLIVKNGADIHSYQPTAADIMQIAECDMIVYVGGEVDTWVNDALEMADNEQTLKLSMSECEGVMMREISSASENHEHEGHEHEGHEHEGHEHGATDEHLWLSLKNAMAICRALCDALCGLDPDDEQSYIQNTEKYIENLSALDQKYSQTVESVGENDRFVLFCDRFPFVYLLDDYGVEYIAAFEGCSADANADFGTVVRLIEEYDAHSLKCVIVCEDSDGRLAQTVVASSQAAEGEILVMNSLQAVSQKQIDGGESYIGLMEENLEVLRAAFGAKN